MRITRIYARLLRLYPSDYQARFGKEMRLAFEEAAAGECGRRPIQFAAAELLGLAGGIIREWSGKLTSDEAARARHLPDCRRMRPVGITRNEWAAGLDRLDEQIGRAAGLDHRGA